VSRLHGQDQWQAAISHTPEPDDGFHFWKSLTSRELNDDYAYLDRCGWRNTDTTIEGSMR
jgi:hypothetical protein